MEHPIGVAVFKNILYCTESKRNAIAFKDLTGDTIIDMDKLTIEKLKGKLKDIGAWKENCKRKPEKYLQEKLREALNNRAASETSPAQVKSHGESPSLNIDFDREIKSLCMALCFGQDGHMYVSTFTGAVYVVQLHFNFIGVKGWHNRGIYKLTFNRDNGGFAEKIVSNGGSLCDKVHGLTTHTDNSFAFSDTGDSCIEVYNPTVKQYSVVVGNGKGTIDGSKAHFSQPTGICFDYGTLFTVDTSTGTLRMTSSVTSLEDYLKHLHVFGETFGLHTKTSTSVIVEIPQAIERPEQVYSFEKKCVDAVMSLTAVTQGPQGSISSVVMEDERRILSLCVTSRTCWTVLIQALPPNLASKVY